MDDGRKGEEEAQKLGNGHQCKRLGMMSYGMLLENQTGTTLYQESNNSVSRYLSIHHVPISVEILKQFTSYHVIGT